MSIERQVSQLVRGAALATLIATGGTAIASVENAPSPAAVPLPLQERTITGASVASDDPSAVFEFDPNLNITWLREWNTNGPISRDAAHAWAAGLTVGNFSGWQLPLIVDTGTPGCNSSYSGGTDCGYNVQTKSGDTVYSEMAYLWYEELGNLAYCTPGDSVCSTPQLGWGLKNRGSFNGMVTNYVYWSGSEYATDAEEGWYFHAGDGAQSAFGKGVLSYAVAVRPGDVNAVPEPQSVVLLVLGIATVALARRNSMTW